MVKKKSKFVHRVTQLDANEFDREIHLLLKNNILEISQFLEPRYFNYVKPELDFLIKLLVFNYSVMKDNSTFGQGLLNVQFGSKVIGRKALLYLLLNYFLPYVKDKFYDASLKNQNVGGRALFDISVVLLRILQFLNLLIFLKEGKYPTLVNRLLGLKLIPKTKRLERNAQYSFMTRELLWHGFMELFTFGFSLINYQIIKRKLFKVFFFKSNHSTVQRQVMFDVNTVCSICGELPVYPCQISLYCIHVACYYCLKSTLLEDNEYACSSCGAKSTANTNLEFIHGKCLVMN